MMIESSFEQELDKTDVLDRMEILSENHPNLMSAMGMEKFKAFMYGDGLKSIPDLQEKISKNGFTNAKYSIGTFNDEKGREETSLFISLDFASNKIIYECDTETTELGFYDFYQVKHMYVIGENGVTVDLTEELESGSKILLCAHPRFTTMGLSAKTKNIYVPDFVKYADRTYSRERLDVPLVLHEIGHLKHLATEPERFDINARVATNLVSLLHIKRSDLEKNIRENSMGFLKPLSDMIDKYAPAIIESEKVASAWACRWMEKKKEQGAVFWEQPYEDYWQQLETALATYKMLFAVEPKKLHDDFFPKSEDAPWIY